MVTETMTTTKNIKAKAKSWVNFLLYALIGFTLAICLRLVVEPSVVIGDSMLPNLKDGEYIINYRLAYLFDKPQYGDVVIVEKNQKFGHTHLIKRVVGLPGDKVEIRENVLYINGQKFEEPYILEEMRNNTDMEFILKENEIFVMGDNRNNSLDSRVIGPIDYKEDVRGKVVFRILPFNQSFKVDGQYAQS